MRSNVKLFTFCMMFFAFFLSTNLGFSKKFDDSKFKFFEWENPIPRFSEMGYDVNEICSIIGDGQLIISNKGLNIDLWTSDNSEDGSGKIKNYHNARVVTCIGVYNKPREEVVDFFLDFENYPKIMEQFTEGGIIKSKGPQHLVRLKQVYEFLIFSLVADFRYLYKQEKNGDLSALMLDGDVGAGITRIEMIPISDTKTLVINTNWMDLENARFIYRTLIKAQPDLKPTALVGASAMLAEQMRNNMHNINPETPDMSIDYPDYPQIPFYYKKSPDQIKTLEKLAKMGTLIFIHPKQWIRTDKGIKSVEFASAIGQLPGPLSKQRSLTQDFTRIDEYFKQARKIEYFEENNEKFIDWKFKFGFGVIAVGFDYVIQSHWINKDTVYFEGVRGDIDPLHGAAEWIDLSDNTFLFVFSAAMQVGDNASWVMKLGRKVPKAYLLGSLFMGTLMVEKQAAWLDGKPEDNTSIASR